MLDADAAREGDRIVVVSLPSKKDNPRCQIPPTVVGRRGVIVRDFEFSANGLDLCVVEVLGMQFWASADMLAPAGVTR